MENKAFDLALLGPKFTNSDLAADKYDLLTRSTPTRTYCHSITEIFDLVESGKIKYGIVPLENVLQGTIRETFDQLFQKNVHIAKYFKVQINYSLVSLKNANQKSIKVVSSHEQALNQCRSFLKKYFSKAKIVPTNSTIFAIEQIIDTNDLTQAAIIPTFVCNNFPVKVIKKDIQDSSENVTSFIIIQKGAASKNLPKYSSSKRYNTSIAFYFSKDQPGTLFEVFKLFKEANINLSRIESRPSRKQLGSYIFFLDFNGHPQKPNIKKVLQELKKLSAFLKILGSVEL